MSNKPTKEEALKAVETLISWAGDDPTREGLIEISINPSRVGSSPAQEISVSTAFNASSFVGLLDI